MIDNFNFIQIVAEPLDFFFIWAVKYDLYGLVEVELCEG